MTESDQTGVATPLPTLPAWLRRALWARWILLACYIAATGAWYFLALDSTSPYQFDIETRSLSFLIVSATLFVLQFLLLLGAPELNWPRPRRKRSIYASLAAGSAIAMLLSLGVGLALMSLYKLVETPESFKGEFVVTNVTLGPTTAPVAPRQPPFDWRTDIPWKIIGIVLVTWAFWFLIFALVGGGEWPRRFGRMYRILIAGTLLELLITLPIDAQVRRRTNCYCGEGTFFSMIVGLTAIFWVFGPGIALLFLIRRRQRLEQRGCCVQCGYNLRGLPTGRCPECGLVFRQMLNPASA